MIIREHTSNYWTKAGSVLAVNLRQVLPMAFALGLSIILATVLIFTNGDILASLSVVGAATAILVSLFRLDWGLNILVGAAIVCDQFETPGFVSLTSKVFYFSKANNFREMAVGCGDDGPVNHPDFVVQF